MFLLRSNSKIINLTIMYILPYLPKYKNMRYMRSNLLFYIEKYICRIFQKKKNLVNETVTPIINLNVSNNKLMDRVCILM